jgi:hypothetical protein
MTPEQRQKALDAKRLGTKTRAERTDANRERRAKRKRDARDARDWARGINVPEECQGMCWLHVSNERSRAFPNRLAAGVALDAALKRAKARGWIVVRPRDGEGDPVPFAYATETIGSDRIIVAWALTTSPARPSLPAIVRTNWRSGTGRMS